MGLVPRRHRGWLNRRTLNGGVQHLGFRTRVGRSGQTGSKRVADGCGARRGWLHPRAATRRDDSRPISLGGGCGAHFCGARLPMGGSKARSRSSVVLAYLGRDVCLVVYGPARDEVPRAPTRSGIHASYRRTPSGVSRVGDVRRARGAGGPLGGSANGTVAVLGPGWNSCSGSVGPRRAGVPTFARCRRRRSHALRYRASISIGIHNRSTVVLVVVRFRRVVVAERAFWSSESRRRLSDGEATER